MKRTPPAADRRSRTPRGVSGGVSGGACGRSFGRRRGQAIIEFALVVPILLAVLIGILEFGWYTKNLMTLSSAAREGARAAGVGKTQSEIVARVNRYASPFVLSNGSGITLEQCDSTGSGCTAMPADTGTSNGVRPPNMVRVTLRAQHQSLTRFIPGLNSRTIISTVTLRREA
jgi:Flp pilus assembly protein TadG